MVVLSSYAMAEDSLRCDEVWRRILPELEPYPELRRQTQNAEKSLTDRDILGFIESEWSDRWLYQALSRKARSKAEMRCLAAMGASEGCHGKKLEAVYFLLTGKRPCVHRPSQPTICSFSDTLRQRYYDELKQQQEYLDAARRTDDERVKKLLLTLADEEAAHADMVWSIFV